MIASILVTLFVVQVMIENPPKQTINTQDSRIDERVNFTVDSWIDFSNSETLHVTYHCQTYINGEPSNHADWYLLQENMMIESFEDLILTNDYQQEGKSCGNEWELETGEYTISTYKTDNIRYEQTIVVHIYEPIENYMRIAGIMIGALLPTLFQGFVKNSESRKTE